MNTRLQIKHAYRQLCAGLTQPDTLLALTETEWDVLLPVARSARLFSRLAALARDRNLLAQFPPRIAGHMQAVLRLVAHRQRCILWEVRQLERALQGCEAQVLLLKGTAYVLAERAAARGRIFADVDILVSRTDLAEVERVLRAAGWGSESLDAYDEHYYRAWMHEIPPLKHPERGVEVDIHHTLSPLTSRLQVDALPLFTAAQPVAGRRFKVLASADLILHSAVHLFYGGEFDNGLRDLSDLDLLLREGAASHPEFWTELTARAETLNLTRPLFYAVRYTRRLFATPTPETVRTMIDAHGPGGLARTIMDVLIEPALRPLDPTGASGWAARARWLLWVRSHWLKMPLRILIPHLWHKAGKHRAGTL